MRIDKFLNAVNLTKRRAIAQDMITEGVVQINGKVVKASKNVAVGDVITLVYLEMTLRYECWLFLQSNQLLKASRVFM